MNSDEREADEPGLGAVVAQQHRPDRLEHPDGQVERDARRERGLDRRAREQRGAGASGVLDRPCRR